MLSQGHPYSIRENHHQGQGGHQEGVQEGPHHVGGEDHKIYKIGRKSIKLGQIIALITNDHVQSGNTVTKVNVDSGREYNKDIYM